MPLPSCTYPLPPHPFGQEVSFKIRGIQRLTTLHERSSALACAEGLRPWLSCVSPYSYAGHLCGRGAVSHLHHACTVFQRVQEESLLKRIMTTKYLMTDYIAGQHDPHRSAMWSLAAKPGCLWETVISGPWLLPAQLYIRAVICQISLACPNKRATAATAEESEGDGSCCIARGWCPLAPQSQAVLLDVQRSLSMGVHHPWASRFPHVYTRVCWHVWAPSPSEGTLSPTGPHSPSCDVACSM